eukprot:494250-Amorphochlora_amoeboformis.AAC.1
MAGMPSRHQSAPGNIGGYDTHSQTYTYNWLGTFVKDPDLDYREGAQTGDPAYACVNLIPKQFLHQHTYV